MWCGTGKKLLFCCKIGFQPVIQVFRYVGLFLFFYVKEYERGHTFIEKHPRLIIQLCMELYLRVLRHFLQHGFHRYEVVIKCRSVVVDVQFGYRQGHTHFF